MNIFFYLFQTFLGIHKWTMLSLGILSLFLSFIYTKVSSKINAQIIMSIQKDDNNEAFKFFWYFVAASIFYLIF